MLHFSTFDFHYKVLHGEKLSKKEHFLHTDGEDFHDHGLSFIQNNIFLVIIIWKLSPTWDYDHDAFLGADEASEFEHLAPGWENF